MGEISKYTTDQLIDFLGHDLVTGSIVLPQQLYKVAYELICIIFELGVLVASATSSIHLAVLSISFLYVVQSTFITHARGAYRSSRAATLNVKTFLAETLSGRTHIDNLRRKEWYWDTFVQNIRASYKAHNEILRYLEWLQLNADVFNLVLIIGAMIFTFTRGDVSATSLGLAIVTAVGLNAPLQRLPKTWLLTEDAIDVVQSMQSFNENAMRSFATESVDIPREWSHDGAVEFRNAKMKSTVTLNGRAEIGDKILICSNNGCGKSSMLHILLGLRPYKGSIKISGIELRNIPPRLLRRNVATVIEEPLDLKGNVLDNLLLTRITGNGRIYPHMQVLEQVLITLNLWHLITAQRSGLRTPLKDLNLSYGQRICMNVARAAIYKAQMGCKIAIVDDALSKVDLPQMGRIFDVLEAAFFDCTIFIVRLNRDADLNVRMLNSLE
ncbi:hypothetical protein VHEMI03133 [[Torrubiella] hemipterigena]|uniref:ABC transporter domain-containing protein n=1 Tax=[Torrubiella] hemipterigena TaxID=1531966 RepID=A0A0A1TA92_9HYPO|nr:hypothetical protein VHEMI03133 [[Torrubiella] hemipterigena]